MPLENSKTSPISGFETHRFRLRRPETPEPELSPAITPTDVGNAKSSASNFTPACDRCRRLKKRCTRNLPECTPCVNAGRRCSYPTGTGPSFNAYKHLQTRVQLLTRYITEVLGHDVGDLEGRIGASSGLSRPANGGVLQERTSHSKQNSADQGLPLQKDTALNDEHVERGVYSPEWTRSSQGRCESTLDPVRPTSIIQPPLNVPDAFMMVDAFFHHVYRAYPFIDKEHILYLSSSGTKCGDDADSIILHMIMAIGYTSLERSGKAPHGISPGFDILYADIMQRCFIQEDIDSIQILVLLALYSLFDARGPSTWSIVGIVTRQAMTQGLTRANSTEENIPPKTLELRRRMFWSIYVLDRMMALSVGQPPGLVVDELDIPYPAITVEEFASADRADLATMLQVSRHVIELRQLEDKVLSTIHLQNRTSVSSLSASDRAAIVGRFRSEIENWYSHGCLISRPEPDNVRVHDTMAWLNARYYHLLLLLYYPCQFNARSRGTNIPALLGLVRKFMQYNRVLLCNRQLPLNRVTLCRFVPVCLLLLHCFAWGNSTTFPGNEEVDACIELLSAFPEQWDKARRLSGIMTEFTELISSHETYSASLIANSNSAKPCPIQTPTGDWLQSLQKKLTAVLGNILGKTSCYLNITEDWEGQSTESIGYLQPGSESPTIVTPPSLFSPNQGFVFSFL